MSSQNSTADTESDTTTESSSDTQPDSSSNEDMDSPPSSTCTTTLGVPGAVTVHDKRKSPGKKRESERSNKPIKEYKCSFCDYTRENEWLVRTHITREDDAWHKNRNAFLDNIHVQAIDRDGNVVEDTKSPKTTNYEGEWSTELLPDGTRPDTKTAEILKYALLNPTLPNVEIAERLYDDRSKSSYVANVLNNKLGTERQPEVYKQDSTGFYDRTEKQQQAILAKLDNPEGNIAEIARATSVSYDTVNTTIKKYEKTIEQLQAKLAAGTTSLESLIEKSEVDPADLSLESIDTPKRDDSKLVPGRMSADDYADNTHESLLAFERRTSQQQAAIIGSLVAEEDAFQKEIAEIAGVSQSQMSYINRHHGNLIDDLDRLIRGGVLEPIDLLNRAELTHEHNLDPDDDDLDFNGPDEVDPNVLPEPDTEDDDESPTPNGDTTQDATTAPETMPLSDNEIPVSKDDLRTLSQKMDTLRSQAMHEADIAPEGSLTQVAAERQMHVIDLVGEFMKTVASNTEMAADGDGTGDGDGDDADE